MPLAAARLRALVLRNPADRPSEVQFEEARRDLAETADCAATNLVCLALLEYGERDLAAVTPAGDRSTARAGAR